MSTTEIDVTLFAENLERLAVHVKARFQLRLTVQQLESAGRAALLEVMHSGRFKLSRARSARKPEEALWAYASRRVFGAMIEEVSKHSDYSREYARESGRKQVAVKAHSAACAAARPAGKPAGAERDKALTTRESFRERMGVIEATRIAYTMEQIAERFDALDEAAPSPEEEMLAADTFKRMHAAIERLPEQQRAMLRQRYFDELSLKEVGDNFGVTEQRACQVIAAARLALRHELESGPPSGRALDHRAPRPDPSSA